MLGSIENDLLIIALALAGSLSPLLTYARLWQLKEWRIDRLKEELSRSGVLRTLFGRTRPVIAGLGVVAALFRLVTPLLAAQATLAALALLAAVQFVTRRQPLPVWTAKALLIVSAAIVLTGASVVLIEEEIVSHWLLVALVLLQPLVLFAAWLLIKPLDTLLKKRRFEAARRLRDQYPDVRIIGITGSVGKTTTKSLLAHLLDGPDTAATPAFVNTELGVVNWFIKIMSAQKPPQTVIVEMGAYKTGELEFLCGILRPQFGVVTFVGQQHVALFGSLEALYAAKSELIQSLPADGHAFLNGDNNLALKMAAVASCPVTTVGTARADLIATDVEETANGIRFSLDGAKFAIPLHGTHNVTNVLLAIAVARESGFNLVQIATRLQTAIAPAQTFALRTERGCTILDDSHNSSPASFQAAIEWAKAQPNDTKVLLCSGLIELGDDHERIHNELGIAAAPVFDRIVCTSKDSAQSLAKGYGKPVDVPGKGMQRIAPGTLLVCEGRLDEAMIRRLLPPA